MIKKEPHSIRGYDVQHALNEGGSSVVWLATRQSDLQQVAIKIVKHDLDPEEVLRFEAEYGTLVGLNHGNIARVYELGVTEQGRAFIVMEYIQGEPITEYCDKQALTLEQRLELFVCICEAVRYVHSNRIIHRDIKPENILVSLSTKTPTIKLIDFGIAKVLDRPASSHAPHTKFGEFLGTIDFMSPEQTEMSPSGIDERSDVYSLGVVLYLLLIGRLPFEEATLGNMSMTEVVTFKRTVEPPTPSRRLSTIDQGALSEIATRRRTDVESLSRELRDELDWIVTQTLRIDRNDRYATALHLGEDIQRYLRHDPILARPTTSAYILKKLIQRNRGKAALIFVTIVAILLAFASTMRQAKTARIAEAQQRSLKADAEKARDDANAERLTALRVVDLFREVFQAADIVADTGHDKTLILKIIVSVADRISRGELSHEPEVEVKWRLEIASLSRSLAQLDEAERMLVPLPDRIDALPSRVSVERKKNYLALSLAELGALNIEKGQISVATGYLKRSIECYNSLARPDIKGLAGAKMYRAYAYRKSTPPELEKAEAEFRSALKLFRDVIPENSPEVVMILEGLGIVLEQSGRPQEALEPYSRAAEIAEQIYPEGSVLRARPLQSYAGCLEALGRFREALRPAREALNMLTLRYGASELDTILCKNTLGMILTRAGDTKEAEEILKSTLQDLDADKLGPHYKPARSLTMNSLGVLYHQINDYKKAIESYSESLALLESIPEGASPFDVALVRSNLADNLRSDHRLDEARRHIEQVIAFFRQHESKHSTLAKALLTAGRIEKEQGNVEKGCSLMNEALTIAKSVWPTDHPELIKMQAIVDQCDE